LKRWGYLVICSFISPTAKAKNRTS